MTSEIQNYITRCRLAGQTDEQITQSLLQNGWTQEKINAVLSSFNNKKISSPFVKKYHITIVLILAIGLLVVTGSTIAAYFLSKTNNTIPEDNQNATQIPTPTPFPTVIVTDSLTTFIPQNKEYLFKYSQNWIVKENNNSITIWINNLPVIVIIPQGQIIPSELLPSSSEIQDVSSKYITVSGKSAMQLNIIFKGIPESHFKIPNIATE